MKDKKLPTQSETEERDILFVSQTEGSTPSHFMAQILVGSFQDKFVSFVEWCDVMFCGGMRDSKKMISLSQWPDISPGFN